MAMMMQQVMQVGGILEGGGKEESTGWANIYSGHQSTNLARGLRTPSCRQLNLDSRKHTRHDALISSIATGGGDIAGPIVLSL